MSMLIDLHIENHKEIENDIKTEDNTSEYNENIEKEAEKSDSFQVANDKKKIPEVVYDITELNSVTLDASDSELGLFDSEVSGSNLDVSDNASQVSVSDLVTAGDNMESYVDESAGDKMLL